MAAGSSRKAPGAFSALRLRHNETFCTRTHENGGEQTEAVTTKTRTKQSGLARTATHSPLSGPRYRGSNPCLPAKFDPRLGTSHNLKIHKHFVSASTPFG